MGNQLSGAAPSHPLTQENYIAELNNRNSKELEFKKSLGSTRFLKVALCMSEKGPVVVKIFVIQDPTLPLIEEKKKIKEISFKLLSSVNCLPYKRVELTERVAFIIRPYFKSSLNDRVSTRPFLTPIEKKWLAFQLLCALNQCHQEKICHGDIKLENILVTSWSWLFLTDFASYKPVLLPEDNPTHFTYYFDTSRKRACHIAPERFIKTIYNGEFVLKPPQEDEAYLTPAMDMFSAGCVLAELFTEGFPFNLMQLLQYRSDHYYPTDTLNKITDLRVRNMVEQMIKKNPLDRPSAAACLEEEKGNLFPEYFYTFLFLFIKQFSLFPALEADERIRKIRESLPDIIEALEIKKIEKDSRYIEVSDEEGNKSSHNESIVILISLITPSIRSLKYPSSKLTTLELFRELSECTPNEIILDRILPYIFSLLKDQDPRVRAESINTLAHCLKLVEDVPRSEANIFLEYILPSLNEVSSDSSILVRQADAANIGSIADVAFRFYQFCVVKCKDYSPNTQIDSLQEVIQQKLAKIFSDPSNIVKRALIENNLGLLCDFFGKEKANDILFSHLITLLNEKRDFHLRISFYNNITNITNFMGPNCYEILLPLFLQGLSDTEEHVITAAINNMTILTENEIFPSYILLTIIGDASPLLIHPNRWIRLAMVGLIVAVSTLVNYLDIITTLSEITKPFLTGEGFQANEVFILSRLKSPLTRSVYDFLVKCPVLESILNILEKAQDKIKVDDLENLYEDQVRIKEAIRRLTRAGLKDPMVELIMLMKDHLTKVNKHKLVLETLPNQKPESNSRPGYIILDSKLEQQPILHRFKLITKENSVDLTSNLLSSSQSLQKSSSLTMNEEWQTMFGNGGPPEENRSNSSTFPSSKPSSLGASLSSQCFMIDPATKDGSKKFIAPCQKELEQLLHRKREEHLISIQANSAVNAEAAALRSRVSENPSLTSAEWRPKGHMVTHIHEHTAAVTKLIPMKGTSFFASSSKDGTFKVWDCNKTERTYPIFRSKFTYNQQHSAISSLAYCSMQESIASASINSSIHVVKIDKQTLLSSRQLDVKEDGHAFDMNYMDAGSQSLLTYSTIYGKIYGWDLRSTGNAWVLDNGVQNGLITSYAIDDNNNWLACGTSSGYIMCWDLRFMISVSRVKNFEGHHIQNLKLHPSEPSWVLASSRAFNEVAFFNMETKSRTKTLWASPEPPFSIRKQRSGEYPRVMNYFHGLYTGRTDAGSVYVLTGGTDSKIRYWDLKSPASSYVISHPSGTLKLIKEKEDKKIIYSTQYVSDSEVIVEKISANLESKKEESAKLAEQMNTGHIGTITDITVVNCPQKMIVSSGSDGTIKMWK